MFRVATEADITTIAALHAASWAAAYRGILSDHYLDHELRADRLALWSARMQQPGPGQAVILALDGDQTVGFICLLADDEPEWGALVDNLHVLPSCKGRGIGSHLLAEAVRWLEVQRPDITALHLWVFADNHAACGFYESRGGKAVERETIDAPGGGQADCLRYHWPHLGPLKNRAPNIPRML